MARKKSIDRLNKKAAALLGLDLEEVQALNTSSGYTAEEMIFEGQSIIYYYEWRRSRIEQERKETLDEFLEREKMWRYKTCKGCNQTFAYSYAYDSIAYCSLDCLDVGLRKIGLQVNYSKPLHQRWGYAHPAIVPAPAFALIQEEEVRVRSTFEQVDQNVDLLNESPEP